MSLQTNENDRPLQVGDRVKYTGSDPAIASVCQGKFLEIFAVQRGLALYWVSGIAGLVTVPLGDLNDAQMDARG